MAIWKRAGSALCGAVAVAAIVGLSAANAMAAPATSLKAKVTGGGSITATSTGKTVLKDGSVSVTCKSSKSTGSIKNGTHSGKVPLSVGTAKTLSFNKCSGPLGAVSNTPESLPYQIQVTSKTTKKGDTDGIIGPVNVAVSTSSCSFTVTGYAPGYYSNSKHELVIGGKLPTKSLVSSKTARLTVSNVSGCLGVVKNHQHPTFSTTYKVNKKVKITVS
jgi:hypothetical protein